MGQESSKRSFKGQVKRCLGDTAVTCGSRDYSKVRDHPENREVSLGIKAIHGLQRL